MKPICGTAVAEKKDKKGMEGKFILEVTRKSLKR